MNNDEAHYKSTIVSFGQEAYESWCKSTIPDRSGLNYPPTWDDLSYDKKLEWHKIAKTVLDAFIAVL